MQKLLLGAVLAAAISISSAATDPFKPYLTGKPPKILRELPPPAETTPGVKVRRVVFQSRDTSEIYALIASPDAPGKHPGMLVFHGGGGSAEEAKAIAWAARGYVAVAPDLPSVANPEKVPNSSGPWKSLKYGEGRWKAAPDASASAMFDGVVSGLQSLYLLRSLPEVDTDRIGVVGISWGGYMTTMVSGLTGTAVRAAFSVYGCGFYEFTNMAGDGPLGKMPAEEREEWLRYMDAGRRAPNIKAAYFVAGAANDFFFFPPGVMATLNAISAEKNHVFGPNASHKILAPGGGADKNRKANWMAMEQEYFDFYLKGEGKRFPVITVISPRDSSTTVRFKVTEPFPIEKAEVWYSATTEPWTKRKWIAVPAQKLGAGVYESKLPPEAQGADWFATASDARPVSVSSDLMHLGAPASAQPLRTAQKAMDSAKSWRHDSHSADHAAQRAFADRERKISTHGPIGIKMVGAAEWDRHRRSQPRHHDSQPESQAFFERWLQYSRRLSRIAL